MISKKTDQKLDNNWAVFEVEENASKPEIKQYLEKGIFPIFMISLWI